MITSALRLAGQRLLPIIAPAGGKALAKEVAKTGALNFALEQGLPMALGGQPAPIGETLLRSVAIGGLSGPVERGILSGARKAYPGISGLRGATQQRLAALGVPQAKRVGGLAAEAGKFGLGMLGATAIVEPLTAGVTRTILPEGYGQGQTRDAGLVGDIAINQAEMTPQLTVQQGMSPEDQAALEHKRRLELIYARNYKFPSHIYHVSQGGTPDPFTMAKEMVSAPPMKYF